MSMTTNTRNKRAQGPSFGPWSYGARDAVSQLCAQAPGCSLPRAMVGDEQGCKLIMVAELRVSVIGAYNWHYILLVQSPSVQCPDNQWKKIKTSSSFYRGRGLMMSNSCTQDFTLKTKQTNSKDNGDTSTLLSLQISTPLYLTKYTLPCVAVHMSYFYSMTAWSILRGIKVGFWGVRGVSACLGFFIAWLWFVPLF